MTDPSTPAEDSAPDPAASDTDRRRRGRMARIMGLGAGLSTVLALLAGAAGATGRAGAAIFLLLAAGSCAVSATYGVVTAVVDDLKGVRVSRVRIAWVVGLFFGAAALMAMTAGVGG